MKENDTEINQTNGMCKTPRTPPRTRWQQEAYNNDLPEHEAKVRVIEHSLSRCGFSLTLTYYSGSEESAILDHPFVCRSKGEEITE